MGRPLNKKYFGNRNIGSTSTTADNGIGGEGVASVTLDVLGAYTTRPSTTFSAPQLPNGVRAVGSVTSQVNIITAISGTMSGYTTGDVVTIGNGTLFTITANGGGTITGATITNRGSYPYAAGALPSGAQTVTNVTVTNPAATGATFAVNYNAKEVLITEPGSGYSSATVTFSQSVTASAVNLTTDNGIVGTTGNQENAIKAYAWIGGSRQLVDIVSQDSSRRYTVRTAANTVHAALLVAKQSEATGEMDITAVDASSNEYWITKLTAHKALLTRKVSGSGVFASGTAQPWTLTGPAAGYVKVDNA